MKNIQNPFFILLFISLASFSNGFSQGDSANEFGYKVNRVYPYVTVTNEEMSNAQVLADLNGRFKASWVREYLAVETTASHNGKVKKVTTKSNTLNQAQKELIKMADAGTEISILVRYIPENTLKHNDPKEFDFSFIIDPDVEAEFIGGQQQLKQYLKENAIDKISTNSFQGFDLTAVKFTINEEGEVVNAHTFDSVFQTDKKEEVEALLLETVRKMPCWKPAEYSNGTKAKQEFVLSVGNMQSCLVPLLNIKRYDN